MSNQNIDKRRRIVQLTLKNKFIRVFKSIEEAARLIKVNSGSICNCCRPTQKRAQYSAGGFKWKYDNSNEKLPERDPLDDELDFLDNPYYETN